MRERDIMRERYGISTKGFKIHESTLFCDYISHRNTLFNSNYDNCVLVRSHL